MENMPTPQPEQPVDLPTTGQQPAGLVIGLIVLGLLVGGVVGYLVADYITTSQTDTPVAMKDDDEDDVVIPAEEEQPVEVEEQTPGVDVGTIDWQERQVISIPKHIFTPEYLEIYVENSEYTAFYKVGQVTSGSYQEADVIIANIPADGMFFGQPTYYFLRQNNQYTLLSRQSDYYDGSRMFDAENISVNEELVLRDLEYPQTFTNTNGQTFQLQNNNNYFFADYPQDILKPVFTDSRFGQVYTTDYTAFDPHVSAQELSQYGIFDDGGFYFKQPDGLIGVYSLQPLIIDAGNFISDQILKVTWNDGTVNQNAYEYTDGAGCGSTNYASVVVNNKLAAPIKGNSNHTVSINPATDLQVVGTTTAGDIYGFTDYQHPYLQWFYDNRYYVNTDKEKLTLEELAAQHPIVFWQDPFNRLIKLTANTFLPAAECGKPVIYLYPQETTDVTVQVAPQGGFTFTEPEYPAGGWQVTADPDSWLTDADGTVWPYLFWEGRGGLYQAPDRGWVIAQDEVDQFLTDKLTALGLVGREITEFKEFWLPRMNQAPYYFVSFYGNQAMDILAPLTITPQPDTVIRVLMDYQPLEAPIEVEPFTITTPERHGFTVVEWGGVIQ